MSHWLKCACGKVRGFVEEARPLNRCICYCKDCQAFAHFLGGIDTILDPQGGSTNIVQLLPARVEFSTLAGARRLTHMGSTASTAARRLHGGGYARCHSGGAVVRAG